MKRYITLLLALLAALGARAAAQDYSPERPYTQPITAGRDLEVGSVHVWKADGHLCLRYEAGEFWRLTETRLRVEGPGWDILLENIHWCICDTTYEIDLAWAPGVPVAIRAEAGVSRASASALCASYYFPRRQPQAYLTWPPEGEEESRAAKTVPAE